MFDTDDFVRSKEKQQHNDNLMVFGDSNVLPRNTLTPEQYLELAKAYLEIAGRTRDCDIVLKLCHETEVALSLARKSARSITDPVVHKEVGTVLFELCRFLNSRRYFIEAQGIQKKADKWM